MARIEFECFFNALRELLLDVWEPNVILESGDEPQTVDPKKVLFPWAIIDLDDGGVQRETGPAALDLTYTFPLYLWLIMDKVAAESNPESLKEKLLELETCIWRDPHMRRTINNIQPNGQINWTGAGRPWPVPMEIGERGIAGYVGVRCQLIVSRVGL